MSTFISISRVIVHYKVKYDVLCSQCIAHACWKKYFLMLHSFLSWLSVIKIQTVGEDDSVSGVWWFIVHTLWADDHREEVTLTPTPEKRPWPWLPPARTLGPIVYWATLLTIGTFITHHQSFSKPCMWIKKPVHDKSMIHINIILCDVLIKTVCDRLSHPTLIRVLRTSS